MATLKDVAKLAGVTVTTVSRMINNRCNVSAKTRSKIEAAMEELRYHPNEMARSLAKKGNNSFIGLIIPTATTYFFSTVIERIEGLVSEAGCKLLLCISNMDAQKEKEYFNMLVSNKVMGIILWNMTQNLSDISNIDAPIMVLERESDSNIPYAVTDNYNGGQLAAQHLLEKGCEHIAFFSCSTDIDTDANKRYAGFRDHVVQRGMSPPPVFQVSWEETLAMEFDEAVATMFSDCSQLDGVFCSSEALAEAVVRYCLRESISVPDDVKVVGYDDTMFARASVIPLTAIHQPVDEICRYAVDSILQRAEGKIIPTSAVFPVHLVERETT